jgi:O-acetyl-ADP-ribose deacetylase (regulator of RNase III)
VRTAALRDLVGGVLVSVVDQRTAGFGPVAQAVARAAGDEFTARMYAVLLLQRATGTSSASLRSVGELRVDHVVEVPIGQDFVDPVPEACRQLVSHMMGICRQRCDAIGARVLVFPAWFNLGAGFTAKATLHELFNSGMAQLNRPGGSIERIEILLPDQPLAPALLVADPVWPRAVMEHCVTVERTGAGGERVGPIPFMCVRYATMAQWQSTLSWWLPEPRILKDILTGERIEFQADDGRTLAEAGVRVGMEFEAMPAPVVELECAVGSQHDETTAVPDDPGGRAIEVELVRTGGVVEVEAVRGDLCLERVDAVVVGMSQELVLGNSAERVIEFAGPSVFAPLAEVKRCTPGEVFVIDGGRLPARHIFLVVQDVRAPGIYANFTRQIEGLVRGSFERADRLQLASLAFTVLFGGLLPVERDECHAALLDACKVGGGGSVRRARVVTFDGGEALARAGGEFVLVLPDVRGPGSRHRLMLGRARTVEMLLEQMFRALPYRHRPPLDSYGRAWTIRRVGDGHVVDPDRGSWSRTPADAGIVAGDVFEFVAVYRG